MDHLELVAAAENADWQHAGGMDQLARHIDRHVTDHLAIGRRLFPCFDRAEIEVVEQRLAVIDNFLDRHF